ncbi:hypothetical protein P7L74_04890 (plasmid) [Tistrella mobilis]|uniref:hypothetical protein n=1 Tax=Tistrella mobilis TaxID=171437 RepID=UPI0035582C22
MIAVERAGLTPAPFTPAPFTVAHHEMMIDDLDLPPCNESAATSQKMSALAEAAYPDWGGMTAR